MAVKITVVLATFNGEKYLPEQLDSYLAQTRLPDELIAGDDGSTDATIALLTRFAKSAPFPVRILRHGGLGASQNFWTTAHEATGTLVAWSDQDDVWSPEKLQTQEEVFTEAGATLVVHGVLPVDEELRPLTNRTAFSVRHQRIWQRLRSPVWLTWPGMTMLFRRELLSLGDWANRPPSPWSLGQVMHDEYISLLAKVNGVVIHLPDRLVRYRQHTTNAIGAAQRLDLADVASDYRAGPCDRVRVAGEWAPFFASLSTHPSQTVRYFESAARTQRRRAELLEAPAVSGLCLYAAHVAQGDYRSRTAAGLSWRAFLRDGYHLARRMTSR